MKLLLFFLMMLFFVMTSIARTDYYMKNNTYLDNKTHGKAIEYNKMLMDNNSLKKIEDNYSSIVKKGIDNSKQYYNLSKELAKVVPKKEELKKEVKKQHKELFNGDIESKEPSGDDKSCNTDEELGNPKMFIFISSSIPKETIENYMNFAKQHKDKVYLVLNGFIGNDISKIRPTINFISKISCGYTLDEIQKKKDKNFKCDIARVDINPLLFKAFKVDKVPAIVYSYISYADIMNNMSIPNNPNPIKDSDFLLIYGDVSIKYALEKFETADAKIGKEFNKK